MSGNIELLYAGSASPTFTSLNTLAASATFVAGACCAAISNTIDLDFVVGGLIKWSSVAPTAGNQLFCYVWGSINDTPTYPQDGSGNNLGADGAITFASTTDRDNAVNYAGQIVLTATANKVYTLKPFSLLQALGFIPNKWGLWMTHNASGGTPITSGSTISYTPQLGQYT